MNVGDLTSGERLYVMLGAGLLVSAIVSAGVGFPHAWILAVAGGGITGSVARHAWNRWQTDNTPARRRNDKPTSPSDLDPATGIVQWFVIGVVVLWAATAAGWLLG